MKFSKHKQWNCESIDAAVHGVKDKGMAYSKASRHYNVPVESLRRRMIAMGAKPWPHIVLTAEKQQNIWLAWRTWLWLVL